MTSQSQVLRGQQRGGQMDRSSEEDTGGTSRLLLDKLSSIASEPVYLTMGQVGVHRWSVSCSCGEVMQECGLDNTGKNKHSASFLQHLQKFVCGSLPDYEGALHRFHTWTSLSSTEAMLLEEWVTRRVFISHSKAVTLHNSAALLQVRFYFLHSWLSRKSLFFVVFF